jgi:hypothetical protein
MTRAHTWSRLGVVIVLLWRVWGDDDRVPASPYRGSRLGLNHSTTLYTYNQAGFSADELITMATLQVRGLIDAKPLGPQPMRLCVPHNSPMIRLSI